MFFSNLFILFEVKHSNTIRFDFKGNYSTDVNEKIMLTLEDYYVGYKKYQKIYQYLKKHYNWNDMISDVRRVISKYEKYQ